MKNKSKSKINLEFQKKGYCIIENFFSKSELNQIDSFLKHLIYQISKNKNFKEIRSLDGKKFQQEYKNLKLKKPLIASKIYDSIQTSTFLQSLMTSKKVLKLISKLLKKKEQIYLSNFFRCIRLDLPKKNFHLLNWHQDFMDTKYKNLSYEDGITIWAPLNDVNEKKGSMELCLASHKERVNVFSKKRVKKNLSEYLNISSKKIKKYKKTIIVCKKGDIVLMSMNCIHRSIKGNSNILRKTLISRYIDMRSPNFINGKMKFIPTN